MALIVVAVNTSELAAISDYEVQVRVNDRVIAKGTIRGHRRAFGWKSLLRKIADEVETIE